MIYPIRNIVAGIGSLDECDPLLASAAAVARRTGADLHLVHAYDLPMLAWESYPTVGLVDGELVREYGESVQKRLEACAREADFDRAVCHTLAGPAGETVLDIADRVGADLIIVGATRHRKLVRMMLGSTSQIVLRRAKAPVLVLRGDLPAHAARVLIGTDLSDFSAGVHEVGLDVVASLFSADQPAIRSLFVLPAGADTPLPDTLDALESSARERLSAFLSDRRGRGRPIEAWVGIGDPANEIVAVGNDWRPDLLIVGKHKDRMLARWLLGSVAESAIRDAGCSALVIPSPLQEQRTLPATWKDSHPLTLSP